MQGKLRFDVVFGITLVGSDSLEPSQLMHFECSSTCKGHQCGLQNNVLELTPRMLSLKLSAVMVSLVALADCYFSA